MDQSYIEDASELGERTLMDIVRRRISDRDLTTDADDGASHKDTGLTDKRSIGESYEGSAGEESDIDGSCLGEKLLLHVIHKRSYTACQNGEVEDHEQETNTKTDLEKAGCSGDTLGADKPKSAPKHIGNSTSTTPHGRTDELPTTTPHGGTEELPTDTEASFSDSVNDATITVRDLESGQELEESRGVFTSLADLSSAGPGAFSSVPRLGFVRRPVPSKTNSVGSFHSSWGSLDCSDSLDLALPASTASDEPASSNDGLALAETVPEDQEPVHAVEYAKRDAPDTRRMRRFVAKGLVTFLVFLTLFIVCMILVDKPTTHSTSTSLQETNADEDDAAIFITGLPDYTVAALLEQDSPQSQAHLWSIMDPQWTPNFASCSASPLPRSISRRLGMIGPSTRGG
jgi:hypothetical protein